MTGEPIDHEILAMLDIALMERADDGTFVLIGSPPRWFRDFWPETNGATLRPSAIFMFLEQFLEAAEGFWKSPGSGLLRSDVWSETYAAAKEYVLGAYAIRVAGRQLLAIERLRSAYGDIHELIQKARQHNLAYDQLRRTEEELRKSEERYRDIFENASDLIQSCSPDGKLMYVNPAWCETLGYTADEVRGLSVFDMIHPASKHHCSEMFARVVSGERVNRIDATFVTKDGRTIKVQGSSSCRFKDGKPVATRSIFRDVTEQKRMEAALAQARDEALRSARLKAEFLANMSHEIRTPMNAIIGMTRLLLNSSLTAEQREFAEAANSSAGALLTLVNDILDFSKIEAGKISFESIDFDLRVAVEGALELVAEAAHSKAVELVLLVDDDVPTQLRGDPGRLRQVLTNLLSNAVKFTGPGEVIVHISREADSDSESLLHFDVTDTGIGISEEAQQSIFGAFSQADGSITRKYGGTGLGLAISKQLVELMGGQIGVQSEPGKGSTFWFTARFEKKPALADLPEPGGQLAGLRVLVVDDNAANRKLIEDKIASWGGRNDNAERGEDALRILRGEAAAGDPFDITILDMHMPGMGGLALAREIKSDPTIAKTRLLLMSALGERDDPSIREAGVELSMTKPVKESQLLDSLLLLAGRAVAPARREEGNAAATCANSNAAFRILVAEDNIVNQKVVRHQLHRLGYTVDAAANGLEAVEALARISYDVVLMDCQMPEMDGFAATRIIRTREGDSRHTIIIAMTADALEGDRERCLAAGMDDYVSKPVRDEALSAILERWTRESGQPSQVISAPSNVPSTKSLTSEATIASTVSEQEMEADDAPGAATISAIDPIVIAELRQLRSASGSDLLSEVIDLFVGDTPKRLAAMREAVVSEAPDVLAREAHALKGSSANLGAMRMHALCELLEEQGRAGTTGSATVLLTFLEEEFERARKDLIAEKSSARATAD